MSGGISGGMDQRRDARAGSAPCRHRPAPPRPGAPGVPAGLEGGPQEPQRRGGERCARAKGEEFGAWISAVCRVNQC